MFTSTYDLPVVGNVSTIFTIGTGLVQLLTRSRQSVIAAISTFLPGNEPLASDQVVNINNAVVRYADEGFSVLVCSIT